MQSTFIVNHVKSIFCLIGGMIMAAMALLDYLNSNLIIAVLTGGLALVLLINSAYLRVRRHHQPKQILEWFFIAYLLVTVS